MPRRPGQPELPTRRERFDELALSIVTSVDRRWQDELGLVEYAVEDAPQLPDDWEDGQVPLSSLVRGSGATPTSNETRVRVEGFSKISATVFCRRGSAVPPAPALFSC